ncbi:MAG TPA: helix-hairpin-helix domain-containing protein, partial [Candidatus Thermoplasmatota archaeon]|nr:helix-hairpin-helix domain-containing protein [Candidatus Thermoplasmatota archaeon]
GVSASQTGDAAPSAPHGEQTVAEAPRRGGLPKGELTDIPGVGKAKAQALEEAGFLDLRAVDEASEEELGAIEGIGPRLAKRIKEELNKMRK